MQMLANMVFGAVLAGLSLGPAAWADAAQVGNDVSHAVMIVAGKECATTPLRHAVAKARAALPELPQSAQ
jgi:hypothetical protein